MTTKIAALAAAAFALTSASATFADSAMHSKMAGHSKMAHSKMAGHGKMAAGVYVCKECKMGFSAADAKKMGYKDPMGHKLTKMAKMPAGFTMGHGKMGGKMEGGKMDHMGGGKM